MLLPNLLARSFRTSLIIKILLRCEAVIPETIRLEVLADNAAWAFCAGDIDKANKISKDVQLKCDCCV